MAKSYYTKELGQLVAKGAMRINPGRFHVISGDREKWSVVAAGRLRPTKVFQTQKEAIQFAEEMASKKYGEVVIHDRSGQKSHSISFAK